MCLHWQGNESIARLDHDLKVALRHDLLTIEELIARDVLPASGIMKAPFDVQLTVRRDDAKVMIDRPDLRIKFVSTLTSVRNLQPMAINVRHGDLPDFGIDFDTGLVDAARAQAAIGKMHSVLADW